MSSCCFDFDREMRTSISPLELQHDPGYLPTVVCVLRWGAGVLRWGAARPQAARVDILSVLLNSITILPCLVHVVATELSHALNGLIQLKRDLLKRSE